MTDLRIERGTDLGGPFVRVRCGRLVDLWHRTPGGTWYRDSRGETRRQFRPGDPTDAEALRALNAYRPEAP